MTHNYSSYWDFLKKTPKNLASIVVIWGLALLLMSGVYDARYEMHIGWTIFSYSFLGLIMFLGWYRPYTIYKKFKW